MIFALFFNKSGVYEQIKVLCYHGIPLLTELTMSDFDDDDFGNFEGAEISEAPSQPETQPVLSWIIQQSPTNSAGGDARSALEEKGQNLEENGAKPNKDAEAVGSAAKDETPADVSHGNDSSATGMEEIKKLNEIVTKKNLEIEELKQQLSSLTLQTEQTTIQFNEKIEKLKLDLEENEGTVEKDKENYKESLESIKSKHKEEIDTLQQQSSETTKAISQHNKDIWDLYEEKLNQKSSQDSSQITKHCIELLEKQNDLLQRKINESTEESLNKFNSDLKKEKKNLIEAVTENMQKQKEEIKTELHAAIKEHIVIEMKAIRKTNEETLKEALCKQHDAFQILLKETLKTENDKFNKILQTTVENTIEKVKEQVEEKAKSNTEQNKKKTLAAKMFLSSALQQIENLYNDSDTC